MKHTKSLFLLFLMALLSIGASAQTNRLYIPNITMLRGSEATLSVFMDNVEAVTAVEFTLEVPNGFTINPASAILTERAMNHQIMARKLKNGKYKFVVMSQSNALIDDIAGRLFTVRIQSPENVVADGDYPLTISDAVMSTQSGANILQETNGGKITIKSMPNLHVVSLECSEPVAGQPLTIKWKVRNDGRGDTGDTEWKDYIWLTPNISVGTSMIGSKLLASVGNVSALAPGDSYENITNVTLDERIYGNYDLVVTSNMYGATNIDYTKTGGEPPIPYDPDNADYGFLSAHGDASYVIVDEENEYNGVSDNFFYKRIDIQIPPLPDIQVPSIEVEVDSIGSGINRSILVMRQFYSGKKVNVLATIANKGGGDIDSTLIKNILYISPTPDLTSKSRQLASQDMKIALKAGEMVTTSFVADIPEKWSGDAYFLVKADAYDAVYELGNTENNVGSSALVDVLVAPGADLVPYDLNVPSQISVGNSFSFGYSVRNDGAGLPGGYSRTVKTNSYVSHSWTDYIYLSTKRTGIDATAICIGKVLRKGRYLPVNNYEMPMMAISEKSMKPSKVKRKIVFVGEPKNLNSSSGNKEQTEVRNGSGTVMTFANYYQYVGDSYSDTYNIEIDNLQEGIYYMYVVVDADDNIYEYNGEYNNVIVSGPITYSVPDVMTELLEVAGTDFNTGDEVPIKWKIVNIGGVDIQNVLTKSYFLASSNEDGSNPIVIGSIDNTVSIPAGGEKVLRTYVTIPNNKLLAGPLFFFVKTNLGNVKETNTANNTSAVITRQFRYIEDVSERVNGINLTVSSVQMPSESTLGSQMSLSYVIKNTGSFDIDRNVSQAIYISKKASFDNTARKLSASGTFADVTNLTAGTSVNANVTVTIPNDIAGGKNYFHVVINEDNAIAEKRKDDNYAYASIFIQGNMPNLAVSDIIVPETIMTSEDTKVQWTLSNTGEWEADVVSCGVYLSTDATYSNDDKLLATLQSDRLAINASQAMEVTIKLEDDIIGTRFLIVRADKNNGLEETDKNDNTGSKPFIAKQSALPDLAISDLSYDGFLRGGQTVTLTAKVKNVGDHATRKDKWTDVFYLSEGYTLDISKAIKLGTKTHVGTLDRDSLYDVSLEVNLPKDYKGYYVLFAVTDVTNAVIEKNENNNQEKTTVYLEDKNDTPADLVVRKLSSPSRIVAGENIAVSYTLANEGTFAAKGTLRDVLYMSKDNKWDESDVMVGTVTGEINLEPGNSIVRKVTGRITNMLEGYYYLIVRTNSNHAIAEIDYDNNMMVQTSTSAIEFTQLSLGTSATVNTSGLFKLPLYNGLNGKTVGLYLTTPENSTAGVYTAFGSVPSTARYEYSASDLEKTEQEILIPNVQAGTYYILAQDNAAVNRSLNEFVIDGEQDAEETTMTLTAREVQFGATTLSIKEGGNNGRISTEISGALLDSIMDFRLVREGEIIPAEMVAYNDQTSSRATFNLNDVETGTYDFISELPDGTQATLPEGFRVVPGANVNLGIKFDAPKAVRIDGYAPVSVTYVNGGNTDIVIRELLLTIKGGELSTTIEGFKTNPQAELHIRPEAKQDIRGYVVIPPGKQETVNYYFRQTSSMTNLNLYIIK